VCCAYFASPELIVCPTAVALGAHIKEVGTGRTECYLQKYCKIQLKMNGWLCFYSYWIKL